MLPGNKELLTHSTESGEVEIWKVPANGIGAAERLTTDGKVLRWNITPSPDGKWVVHTDKDNQFWLLDLTAKTNKLIATATPSGNSSPAFTDICWSPDSRYISYSVEAKNTFDQVMIYSRATNLKCSWRARALSIFRQTPRRC